MKWPFLMILLLSLAGTMQIFGQAAGSFDTKSKRLAKIIKFDWNSRESGIKITHVEFEGCRVTIEKSVSAATGPAIQAETDEKNDFKIWPAAEKSLTVFDLKYLDPESFEFEPDESKSFDKLTVSTFNEDKEIFWYSRGNLKERPLISSKVILFVKKKNSENARKLFSELIKTCQNKG